MSEEQTERNNGRLITTYLPAFKDTLAKPEKRGLGQLQRGVKVKEHDSSR
ncbi:MAG: hypothetical protein AB7G08_31075 [Hyphomicrobiaceae bacterium]